jgi:hypothetical protein
MDEKDKTEYRKFSTTVMMEAAKLLITLASGFIVLSISFLSFVGKGSTTPAPLQFFWLMILSWTAALLSIGFGILSLGGIATTAHDKFNYDVDDPTTRLMLKAQQISFVVGFILFCIFAAVNH